MVVRLVMVSMGFACVAESDGVQESGSDPVLVDTGTRSADPTSPGGALVRGSLVVPGRNGMSLLDLDGTTRVARSWTELAGDCARCGGEGASPDGEGLLLSFTYQGRPGPGGIARVDANGELDFRVDDFAFPHDVIRDPADDTLIVASTQADALEWIAGDGTSDVRLRTLSSDDAEFPPRPNGMERLDHGGRTYVLVSHRDENTGRITLWDITEPGTPTFQWRFPPSGEVAVPHGPILRQVDEAWWLLWAHTDGQGDDDGTVGLAVTDDPTRAPTYVADLAPGPDVGTLTFLRGVELLDDGTLYLTVSGRTASGNGRIVQATFPDLQPPATGASGARGDQVFVPLGAATEVRTGLTSPFEAWYWPPAP